MRTLNANSISAGDAAQATLTGTALNVSFMKSASCAVVATGAPVGTLKLQYSNDTMGGVILVAPTNWIDIPSATVAVSAAGNFSISPIDISYNWIRAFYTKTSGTGAITADIHCIGD